MDRVPDCRMSFFFFFFFARIGLISAGPQLPTAGRAERGAPGFVASVARSPGSTIRWPLDERVGCDRSIVDAEP